MKLEKAIKHKQPELASRKCIMCHQANTRPHTYLVTRQTLLELGWHLMSHPLYSPGPAPSDYYLFRFLQNSFNRKNFTNDGDF